MSFESMLVEVCTIKRAIVTASTDTGRQKRQFAVISENVPCLIQAFGGAKSGKSGGSGGSNYDDEGFVPRYEWRFFLEVGQDVQAGDRVVSATRGFTGEVYSVSNAITPSYPDGHHLELRIRQMVHEGP